MSYLVRYGGAGTDTHYSVKDHTLIDEGIDQRGNVITESRPGAGTVVVGEAFRLYCNTTGSLTFAGIVRSVRRSGSRSTDWSKHLEVQVDDWRPALDGQLLTGIYSSIRADSLVRDLVTRFAPGFTTNGVHSFKFEHGAYTVSWDFVSCSFNHDHTLSQGLDSIVGQCADLAGEIGGDDYDYSLVYPPTWRVTADLDVVFDSGAIGTCGHNSIVVVDATNLDVQMIDQETNISSLVTRVWGYCGIGSTTISNVCGAGGTTLTVEGDVFGYPASMTGANALYVKAGAQLIQVHSIDRINLPPGLVGFHFLVNSLDHAGAVHDAIAALWGPIRAVALAQSTTTQNYYGSLSGHGVRDLAVALSSLITDPAVAGVAGANVYLTDDLSRVNYLRLITTDSLVRPHMVLAMSIGALAQGLFRVQRVRVSGFGRGENLAPTYDVEATMSPASRIEDLLPPEAPPIEP